MLKIGVGDVRISPQARANVLDALDNNRLSYGKWTRQFESEFAKLHHRTWACFVNSGTSALQIALAALKEKHGWSDGDEVLVPALTFVASVNVIIQNGLVPILADVDPDYYDMWPADRYYAGSRQVAVLPVSLFGQPIDPLVGHIARQNGLVVIEDSCETMFVGRSTADVTCYSTYACHLINTGVGGFATTDDPELATLIRSYANHGRDGIYTGIDDALGQWETMSARFRFERMGYSYRATELEAAIGCAELTTYQSNLDARRANARVLTQELRGLPLQTPKERVAGDHAYMMFPIVCETEFVRDGLVQHLETNGIETRPMLPLTNQPYLQAMYGKDLEDRFPNAKRINHQGFYIGSHQYLTEDDLAHIVETFHAFFR